MVEPHSSNFRVITTNCLGVRIFRKFTVCTAHGRQLTFTICVSYVKHYVYNICITSAKTLVHNTKAYFWNITAGNSCISPFLLVYVIQVIWYISVPVPMVPIRDQGKFLVKLFYSFVWTTFHFFNVHSQP